MTEQEAKKVVDIIVGAGDKECAREMIVRFILNFPDHARIARRVFREKFGEAVVRDEEMARSIIREVIHKVAGEHGVDVEKIILFGSRARGDHSEDSDWDVLVVVRQSIRRELKIKFAAEILEMLANYLIPCDIIVKSILEINKKAIPGTVVETAVSEGVIL